MSTTKSTVADLYADIIADLQPYYDDAVLLPNNQLILNTFSIAGSAGNTVRIPITNSYTAGASVNEGASIKAAANSIFDPSNVTVTLTKKGVGSDVTEEALEDGGLATVRNAILTRLSRGLAQAVDTEGFQVMRDAGGNASVNQDGNAGITSGNVVNIVASPEAMAFAEKRTPSVRVWYDPDFDLHQFRASLRNGFAAIPFAGSDYFIRKLTDHSTIGSAGLTLGDFAKSVSELRAVNAPTAGDGAYVAFIAPSTEYSIASQLNSVTQTAIGSLSDIGNRALLSGLIGQAAGLTFIRSNNLPAYS